MPPNGAYVGERALLGLRQEIGRIWQE